jgi:hypothetical protein
MQNASHPTPPNKSEGCFICGEGLNEILSSKLVQGGSVALCSKHQHATTLPPKGAKV